MSDRSPYSARLPADESRDHLMIQAAKLYYDLDRTQAQVADELGLTRWQVGRLLAEAKAEGVVRVEIVPRARRATGLEAALQARWNLREALVVPMGGVTDPDMLNEGIHTPDVSGVILFRPTVSPTVYKQQIGRALSCGSAQTPLILDVVNNVENLYSIGTIQEEMQAAIT